MKIRMVTLAAACVLALSACGNDSAPPATPAATPPADQAAMPTEPAPAATPAAAATPTPAAQAPAAGNDPAVVADCATHLDSNDAMQYDADSITIPSSCTEFTIRLTHSGTMPVAAMGHNVVISSLADMPGVVADGMGAGLDNNYVKPGDTRVIAHSEVIGGGGETSITFPVSKLQSGGPYEFFCSFPGHSALMKGTISVE